MCIDVPPGATGACSVPGHAAAPRSASEPALQEILLHLQIANLLVKLSNETLIVLPILVLVIAKDTCRPFRQGLLPGAYLARVYLKPASQFGMLSSRPLALPGPLWP